MTKINKKNQVLCRNININSITLTIYIKKINLKRIKKNQNYFIKSRYNSIVFLNNASQTTLFVLISTKTKINIKNQVQLRNNNIINQKNLLSNKKYLQNILKHLKNPTTKILIINPIKWRVVQKRVLYLVHENT